MMDTDNKKKEGRKSTNKTLSGNGGSRTGKKRTRELTEEEIRAEKRIKLTLKAFRLIYEDPHKSR